MIEPSAQMPPVFDVVAPLSVPMKISLFAMGKVVEIAAVSMAGAGTLGNGKACNNYRGGFRAAAVNRRPGFLGLGRTPSRGSRRRARATSRVAVRSKDSAESGK